MYQSRTGAWNASRSSSLISVSNKPPLKTASRASSESIDTQNKKGKQRQSISAASPPEPSAQAAQEAQSKGPLGAPVITTSEPQILEEEAEEDDLTDETSDQDGPSPVYATGQEDEFRNVWGHEHL